MFRPSYVTKTKRGIPMYMSDGEILTSFNQAKDPVDQIDILAQLNSTTVDEIKMHLSDLGADIHKIGTTRVYRRTGASWGRKPRKEKTDAES